MRNRFLICILGVYSIPFFCSAQTIDSLLSAYSRSHPLEKSYVQFDKQVYVPGDRIWYKAYILNGAWPSLLSRNYYIELYDESGKLLIRNINPVFESTTSGSFDLPLSFKGAFLRVRAYTGSMMNFDSSFVYTREIYVTGSPKDSLAPNDNTGSTLHFFPEGGNLISNVSNNMAFKAVDKYEKPISISGTLYDQHDKSILDFSTAHRGMGQFILIPGSQDRLYALWKDEKGVQHRTDLAPVQLSGIGLRVINNRQKIYFSVSKSTENSTIQQVTVVGTMNQQVMYKASVGLKDVEMNGGFIPTEDFPTGIFQLTVLDDNQMPLAERICFVNNQNYHFEATADLVQKNLNKKGQNMLEIDVPDTLYTNMSVSVTDAGADGFEPESNNIITSLLLSGDLHGRINDPYYYFQDNSDSLAQQLDLVMLTHGWRRYKWTEVVSQKNPGEKYPAKNYLSLHAELSGIKQSRISKDETMFVILQNKDSSQHMLTLPYIKDAEFGLDNLIYYDTVKLFYQFSKNKDLNEKAVVAFDNGIHYYMGKPDFSGLPPETLGSQDQQLTKKYEYILHQELQTNKSNLKVQNLKAVTINSNPRLAREKLNDKYSSGLFNGGNGTILDIMNDPTAFRFINIWAYLQGKVPGLQVTLGDPPVLRWRNGTPAVYLNEMKMDDYSTISTLNVNAIAMVKVYSPGASGRFNVAGGMISIYTKKGDEYGRPDPSIKGLSVASVPGYAAVKEFYSPDYSTNPIPETEDRRTTVYWNPNIIADKDNRKINLPFFNSDLTHRIRIVLEGFNEAGKLIHIEKVVE